MTRVDTAIVVAITLLSLPAFGQQPPTKDDRPIIIQRHSEEDFWRDSYLRAQQIPTESEDYALDWHGWDEENQKVTTHHYSLKRDDIWRDGDCCVYFTDASGSHVLQFMEMQHPMGDECDGSIEQAVELRTQVDNRWPRTWRTRKYVGDWNCKGLRGDRVAFIDARDFDGDGNARVVHGVLSFTNKHYRVYVRAADGGRFIGEVKLNLEPGKDSRFEERSPAERHYEKPDESDYRKCCPSDVTLYSVDEQGETTAAGRPASSEVKTAVPKSVREYLVAHLTSGRDCSKATVADPK